MDTTLRGKMLREPIFVVGVPRSGTTLLQSMLSAHPLAYSLPETHFFSTILPRLHKSAQEPLDEERLNDALTLLQDLMDFRPTHEQRSQLHTQATIGELTGQGLFEFMLDCYRPVGGEGLRVVEKTPLHVEHMSEILALMPSARFIHIVRDPRNAISSLLRTDFAPTNWLLWYTQYWNYVLALAERFTHHHPDAILTVRYETLVEDPPGTLHGICEFLGMQYEDEMITDFSSQQRQNVLTSREPWKKRNQEGQIHSDPDAWRQRLHLSEVWLVEWLTKNNMARLGYAPAAHPTWRDKTAILWRSLRQPRHDRRAAEMGHYLIEQCRQQGLNDNARLLAVCLAMSDSGQLRDRELRRMLWGKALPS